MTEKEKSLDFILNHPVIAGILGEDLQFDLITLLLQSEEDGGENLRNHVAHGLLNDTAYFQEDGRFYSMMQKQILYLWWLVLKLCFGIKRAKPEPESTEPSCKDANSSPAHP